MIKIKNKNSLKNKKAVSVMVGYVLLISFAVIIGVIIYAWVKTYVPRDGLECDSGTSLFIKDYNYNCSSDKLTLIFVNNGRFNIGGYFIKATNSSEQKLATIDIAEFIIENGPTERFIRFGETKNYFKPRSGEEPHVFDLSSSGIGQIHSIEIIPVRWQEEKNKELLVSCTKAKVKQLISCS